MSIFTTYILFFYFIIQCYLSYYFVNVGSKGKKNPRKPLFFKGLRGCVTIRTPRRETYYPCESLIFKAFNGYYYTFFIKLYMSF